MEYNVYKLVTGETDEKEVVLREADENRQSLKVYRLPFGLKLLKETRGCFYLTFITTLWAYNSYFIPTLVLGPMYRDQQLGIWALWVFLCLSALTFISLVRSSTSDPGFISLHHRATTADQINWTHCRKCLIQRPLKSHHCSRCNRCVRRMDHHCPWINNCIGEDNQWIFVLLLLYGLLLSGCALLLDVLHFYYFKPCSVCDKDSFVWRHQRYLMYGCFGSGMLLGFFCISQFITQVFNISMDKTTVESLIYGNRPLHEQPKVTKTVMDNFHDVFGRGRIICWLNPLRKRRGRNIIVYADVA
ncbi:palmitoyltransferase ZDHHC21-like [Diadema setosum]|uniref:palmitoyltransferase ZDHHC21-like n=1 Tax=Diadema setosum TaxID=31175 RepID=UPI003B3AF770